MEMRLEGGDSNDDYGHTGSEGGGRGYDDSDSVGIHAGISLPLAQQMIEEAEEDGDVCRDDVSLSGLFSNTPAGGAGAGGGLEVKWWPNLFVGYVWDGQVFSEE